MKGYAKGPRVAGDRWAYVYETPNGRHLLLPERGARAVPRDYGRERVTSVLAGVHPSLRVRRARVGRGPEWIYEVGHAPLDADGSMYLGWYDEPLLLDPELFVQGTDRRGAMEVDRSVFRGRPVSPAEIPRDALTDMQVVLVLASARPPLGFYRTMAELLDAIGDDPVALRALGMRNYLALREGGALATTHANPRRARRRWT